MGLWHIWTKISWEDEYIFKQLYENDRVNEEETNDYQNGKNIEKSFSKAI